jgi:bile acid-coenzyme A ligase
VVFTQEEIAAAMVGFAVGTSAAAKGLGQHFADQAAAHPDREALVSEDRRLTYAQVDRLANQVARVLAGRGAGPGRTVAIVLPNQVAFHVVAIAAWKLGATAVPISHRAPERERVQLYDLARPAVAVVASADPCTDSAMLLDELLQEAAERDEGPHPDVVSQPWLAIASGGSTGTPKLIVKEEPGPMHPAQAAMLGMRPGGRQLIAGPLYHSGPFSWGMIHLLAAAGTIVIMPRFDAEAFLATVESERIAWAMVVPTMMHRIMQLPAATRARYDLSSLEVLLHGAAACAPALKREFIDFLGADRVWEVYGSTEVGLSLVRGDEWLQRPGTVGKLLPSYDVQITDDNGRPLPVGEVGEIWIRPHAGPTFSYRGEQREKLRDGYVSVGDLGRLDEDGYLYLADRRSDLIISGGANIFPTEVEAALLEHPAIADVGVIGLPHPEWGQQVHAIVQPLAPAAAPEAEELDAFCRERLMAYKVPKSYEYVVDLTRDPSGKLRRGRLREERAGR